MDRRPLIALGGAVALFASVFAVRRLLADPCIRRRLGLGVGEAVHCDDAVDLSSEDSFPASDPPSFTATKVGVK